MTVNSVNPGKFAMSVITGKIGELSTLDGHAIEMAMRCWNAVDSNPMDERKIL